MRTMNPLIEELVVRAAGKFLDYAGEIVRFDVLKLIPLQISFDGFAIKVLAQLPAQHVQDPRAFRINAIEKDLHRIVVTPVDEAFGVIVGGASSDAAAR